MDPESNYEEQRQLYGSTDPANVERRAELIHAMRDWIRRGGTRPRGYVGPAWEPKSNLPARLSDVIPSALATIREAASSARSISDIANDLIQTRDNVRSLQLKMDLSNPGSDEYREAAASLASDRDTLRRLEAELDQAERRERGAVSPVPEVVEAIAEALDKVSPERGDIGVVVVQDATIPSESGTNTTAEQAYKAGLAWADREWDAIVDYERVGPWIGTSLDALPLVQHESSDERFALASIAAMAAAGRWADLVEAEAIGATIGDDADDRGPDTRDYVSPDAIDDMFAAYVDAALFSSTDENGEPLDLNYDISNIDQETKDQMRRDVTEFLEAHLNQIGNNYEEAGHDFWLTRNRHGVGFASPSSRSRAWPEPAATILANAARAYGEFDIYVGNGGKIYH